MQQAKKEGKLLFVDGYAVWCGPCKRLASQVFPTKEAGDYFNTHFINVKMDMEKGEGLSFRQTYPISAFPTLFFIAPDGQLISSMKGAPRDAQALIAIAEKARSSYNPIVDYRTLYEEGDRSYETYLGLVKNLGKEGDQGLQYANEYLRTQSDLSTEENLIFLFEALVRLDSRVFDEFASNLTSIQQLFSSEEIHDKVHKAAMNTLQAAIKFEAPMLMTEAVEKFAQIYPNEKKEFENEIDIQMALLKKDSKLFMDAAEANKKNIDKLTWATEQALTYFSEDAQVMKKAEKWAKSIVNHTADAKNYYLLAMTQVRTAKYKDAIDSLNECIRLTPSENARELKSYQDQIEKINQL